MERVGFLSTAVFWETMNTHFQLDVSQTHPAFGRLQDLFEKTWKEQGYIVVEKETQAKARLMDASQAEGVCCLQFLLVIFSRQHL